MTLSASSAINPQTSFGADVISRISYIGDDPDKLSELQRAVMKQINSLIKEVFKDRAQALSERQHSGCREHHDGTHLCRHIT